VIQRERLVPFTASVGVSIPYRRRRTRSSAGICDRRCTIGGAGVAFYDRGAGIGDRIDAVLLVAVVATLEVFTGTATRSSHLTVGVLCKASIRQVRIGDVWFMYLILADLRRPLSCFDSSPELRKPTQLHHPQVRTPNFAVVCETETTCLSARTYYS
jgi:hypothetical protein